MDRKHINDMASKRSSLKLLPPDAEWYRLWDTTHAFNIRGENHCPLVQFSTTSLPAICTIGPSIWATMSRRSSAWGSQAIEETFELIQPFGGLFPPPHLWQYALIHFLTCNCIPIYPLSIYWPKKFCIGIMSGCGQGLGNYVNILRPFTKLVPWAIFILP